VAPSTTTDWRTIMLKERAAGLAWGIYGSNDAGLTAGYVHIGADIVANGNARLPINAWSHVALTFDGATLRLYINGTLNTATSVSGATATSALPLRIGGNSIWGEFFSGRIDDVRIYNRPLSSSEVQSDMATPVP